MSARLLFIGPGNFTKRGYMQWIVQNASYNNDNFQGLINALDAGRRDYQRVDVIPFSHELIPVPVVTNPCAIMGTNSLIRLSKKYDWSPGAWFKEDVRFEEWLKHYGEHLVNYDATICRFADADFEGMAFIRPCEDLKQFSGMEMEGRNFALWRDMTIEENSMTGEALSPDMMVLVAPLKNINGEFRLFVVDGEVVAHSQYRVANRILPQPTVPDGVLTYAKEIIDLWQPDKAYVLDIAELENEYKVLEINCLNSSGFYAADPKQVVDAIEVMLSNP